jgi:hypothetical protein
MTNQEKKEWVKNYCGDSFVRGVSIDGDIATVVVRSESGEKEVKISLPNKSIGQYK